MKLTFWNKWGWLNYRFKKIKHVIQNHQEGLITKKEAWEDVTAEIDYLLSEIASFLGIKLDLDPMAA